MASKKRNKIDYEKAAKLWEQGKSYEQMAAALGVRGKEKADPFKPMRAIISNMLNGRAGAWTDKNGKVLTLAPRVGMHKIGKGKKAPKPKAEKKHRSTKRAKVHKSAAKPQAATKLDGKQLAAGEGKE